MHGGQQPVSGATIQLFAVAPAGSSASILLNTQPVTTDASGSFGLTGLYTCPSATTNVYMTATGGNPGFTGSQNNPALGLMVALGHCGNLTPNTFISINEVTTVAAVYALAPYMQSYQSVSAGASDSAFALASALADSSSGVTPGAPVAGVTVPADKVRTLANIISSCVNSNGTDGICNQLFTLTSSNNAPMPADTIGALLGIANNPTQNVMSLYTLTPPIQPFQPTMTSAPSDWTLPTLPAGPALAIASAALPVPVTGVAYSAALQAQGGTPSYTWSIKGGNLPSGLTLAPATGIISGVPNSSGTFAFTVQVADKSSPGQTAAVPFAITAVPGAPALNVSGTLPAGTAGAVYSAGLSAAGGTPSYTWTLQNGSLPAGLSLSANTGMISGTPNIAGTFNFTLGTTDSANPVQAALSPVSLTIANATSVLNGSQTWYVRPDGGTRYSSRIPDGQCDGLSDVSYPGHGVNQHCAFNDVRYLWQDGAYSTGDSFPGWGWIGKGGDTYLIRGSIATGTSYRVGWPNQNGSCVGSFCLGLAGDPYDSGAPPPPSGTADQHTRILGENFASCHVPSARTQLHGGFGVATVLSMRGASYVDVACLDITDFSACTVAATQCNRDAGSLDDYATNGIAWTRTSTHDTLTDVRIHGIAGAGMFGPTGDGVTMKYLDLIGNGTSGWNADPGDGTTGTGTLLVQNFNISWNGCSEEYPLVDALPYDRCHDDNSSGYGDGFGTTTVTSVPGWAATFDQGVVSYNTQDGLDALHLVGNGSSMTISRVNAFGNMGQQLKVGGAAGSIVNSVITGNCMAMAHPIPGTPAGYNKYLGDFCRAADTAVVLTVGNGSMTRYAFNTLYTANATGFEIDCDSTNGRCGSTALIDFRNNVFVGYTNNAATGYNPGNGNNASPTYQGAGVNPMLNPGSFYSNNLTFRPKATWPCGRDQGETNSLCVDPQLVNEAYPGYDFADVTPSNSSPVQGAGTAIAGITTDFNGLVRKAVPSIGAIEFPVPVHGK